MRKPSWQLLQLAVTMPNALPKPAASVGFRAAAATVSFWNFSVAIFQSAGIDQIADDASVSPPVLEVAGKCAGKALAAAA